MHQDSKGKAAPGFSLRGGERSDGVLILAEKSFLMMPAKHRNVFKLSSVVQHLPKSQRAEFSPVGPSLTKLLESVAGEKVLLTKLLGMAVSRWVHITNVHCVLGSLTSLNLVFNL